MVAPSGGMGRSVKNAVMTRHSVSRSRFGELVALRRLRAARWALWCLVAMMAVSVSGCGGCGKRQKSAKWGGMSEEEWRAQYQKRQDEDLRKEKEAEKARQEAEKKKQQQKEQEASKTRRVVAGSRLNSDVAGNVDTAFSDRAQPIARGSLRRPNSTAPPLPPLPALPEAFADWTDRDYVIARMKGDPQLPAAVQSLGEKTVGDPQAAELLLRLLQPRLLADLRDRLTGSEPPKRATRGARGKKSDAAALIEAIVAALGANGTEPAKRALVELITGQLETEDDRTAAVAAVRALAENAGPAEEEVLFRLLTAPEKLPPAGRGDIGPDELRNETLAVLKTRASSELRVRVARTIVDPATPPELRKLLGQLTAQMHPANLEAQLVLLQSELIDAKQKSVIEQDFIAYGSDALAERLRLPRVQIEGTLGEDWLDGLTRTLWSREAESAIRDRLSRADSLGEDARPLLLAATIPTDSMRSVVYGTLKRHWMEGPDCLQQARVRTSRARTGTSRGKEALLLEPGVIVTLKKLLREEQREDKLVSTQRVLSGGRVGDIQDIRRKWLDHTGEVEEEWLDVLDRLETTLFERVREQAENRFAAGRSPDLTPAVLPLELHSLDHVVAAYHFDWQSELAGLLESRLLNPLEIRYVRIEELTRPGKIVAYYRRRMRDPLERQLDEGYWLEGLERGSEPGRIRAVDVRITRAISGVPRLPDEEQPLVIDVLSVEIREPADVL
jgi:hypothetical protein